MTKDWILQTKETRRTFATATWVPLRGYYNNESGDVKNIGYISEWFGCNAVAYEGKGFLGVITLTSASGLLIRVVSS